MFTSKRVSLAVLSMLMFAAVATASTFRAADIVYLPAVARLPGAAGAFFKTDVTITNTSTSQPGGRSGRVRRGERRQLHCAEHAHHASYVRVRAAAELIDIAQSALVVKSANGYLIFFSCREGGNCTACDTSAGDCLNITVHGRIYSDTPGGTFGQSFPADIPGTATRRRPRRRRVRTVFRSTAFATMRTTAPTSDS